MRVRDMPVPQNNISQNSVNGTLAAAVLLLQGNSKQARILLSGTYTGVTGTIDLSNDQVTWVNAYAQDEQTGGAASGTLTASAANKSYLVNNVTGWNYIRFDCTACASGTLTATVMAANSLGANPAFNIATEARS